MRKEGVAAQVLIKLGADLSRVRQQVIQLLSGYQGSGGRRGRCRVGGGAVGGSSKEETGGEKGGNSQISTSSVATSPSLPEHKLDPMIGRRREVERVMQILSRRTKNNPVLIGEPGVGKTAIVEGLAQMIVNGDVPDTLRGKQLYTLDLGALVAGAATAATSRSASRRCSRRSRAAATSFCSSTRSTPSSVPARPKGDRCGVDSRRCSPAASCTIGATTLDEYRKYVEKDAALGAALPTGQGR